MHIDGIPFKCTKCGDCCRWDGEVRITQDDGRRLSEHLDVDTEDFYSQFCKEISGKKFLKNKKNKTDCIFLEDNECSVHEFKPEQCASYPKNYEERCPGFQLNRGKPMSGYDSKVADMNSRFSSLQSYEKEVISNLFRDLKSDSRIASVANSVINEGIDVFFNPDRIKVSSLDDLFAFNRVDASKLIHKCTKDLWTIEKNSNGEVHITRLFNDGEPVRG